MEFYNEQRTRSSPDLKHAETPPRAFHNRKVPHEIRRGNPNGVRGVPMTSGTDFHMIQTPHTQ